MENSILQKVKDTEKLFEGYEIIGNELARVTALREKLEQQHMTVSVIGQFAWKERVGKRHIGARHFACRHISRDRRSDDGRLRR